MKPLARSLALALLLAPQVAMAAGDTVFAGTQVFTIDIEFPQTAWWDSLVVYYEAGLEQMLAATVTIDGVAIDSVGVRFKGNASYTHPNDKKPFRLAFDEFRAAQRWDALKGVHLNNCWEDPTFIREKLHLDFCRDAGVPAPRGNFADLSLNGEHWGFYSLVEHVDKTFMTDRYGNNDGNRYKAVDGFLGGPSSDFKWYGSDPGSYTARYELKSDSVATTWHDLIAVIDSLNNGAAVATTLPPVVNLTSLYRAFATDILFANLDSYVGSCRNFYLYFEETTGRMEWIVWDTGMSFGSYWSAAQNYETLGLTYVSSPANRPLAAKLFADPTLGQDYLVALCGLYTRYFSSSRLLPQVTALADRVRPYVEADPRKMYTNAQFETNLTTDITVGGHRKPGLTAFIAARELNVAEQLDALGVSCASTIEPGDVVLNEFAASNTLILDPAGEAEDWIELFNTTDVDIDLGGMYLSDDPGAITKWQFPAGTLISAGAYLIVWADEDEGQSGLHAGFKLSANGEHLLFADTQAVLLDSVTFGAQQADWSWARIPNGTGAWEATSLPTPGAANQGSTAVDGILPTRLFLARAVPNPSRGEALIEFGLPAAGRVRLDVFDVGGRRIATLIEGDLGAGLHGAQFNGAGLAAGVYLYRLQAGGETAAGRLLIIK